MQTSREHHHDETQLTREHHHGEMEAARKSRELSFRPVIIVRGAGFADGDDNRLEAIVQVQNIGPGPALSLVFELWPIEQISDGLALDSAMPDRGSPTPMTVPRPGLESGGEGSYVVHVEPAGYESATAIGVRVSYFDVFDTKFASPDEEGFTMQMISEFVQG